MCGPDELFWLCCTPAWLYRACQLGSTMPYRKHDRCKGQFREGKKISLERLPGEMFLHPYA